MSTASIRPLKGIMFGLTHAEDGAPIIREARILKVGIGLPRGRALNCWIHNDGKWYFRIGKKGPDGKLKIETATPRGLATRADAEAFYRDNYAKADLVAYPRKLGFFTFTRPVISDEGEIFEPDFPAIEAHGTTPTEIDIVFLDDNPFDGAYQMWSTSELKCKGDGINAMRVLSMGSAESKGWQEAKDGGEKYFPIVDGCWIRGCPYAEETEGKPSPCKPGGDLRFQLARNIRVGGSAYFHTSGFRSIAQIFSSLERIKTLTGGRLAGIPLKMVLRPYRTKHNSQPATQYGVGLEFRAEDIESLRRNLIEQAWKFRDLAGITAPPQPRLIESVPTEPAGADEDDDDLPITAQVMASEFYPEEFEDADPPLVPATAPQANQAKAATDTKTAALTERLAEMQQKLRPSPTRKTGEPYAPAIQQTMAIADPAKSDPPKAISQKQADHTFADIVGIFTRYQKCGIEPMYTAILKAHKIDPQTGKAANYESYGPALAELERIVATAEQDGMARITDEDIPR